MWPFPVFSPRWRLGIIAPLLAAAEVEWIPISSGGLCHRSPFVIVCCLAFGRFSLPWSEKRNIGRLSNRWFYSAWRSIPFKFFTRIAGIWDRWNRSKSDHKSSCPTGGKTWFIQLLWRSWIYSVQWSSRKSSPDTYKVARTRDLAGGEFSLYEDSQISHEADSLRQTLSRENDAFKQSRPGHLSEERLKLRAERERASSPTIDQDAVRAILKVRS